MLWAAVGASVAADTAGHCTYGRDAREPLTGQDVAKQSEGGAHRLRRMNADHADPG